jgi:hypothetical protein
MGVSLTLIGVVSRLKEVIFPCIKGSVLMLTKMFIFFAALLFDMVYAAYIIECGERRAVRASLLSGLIFILSAIMTLAYVDDPFNLLFVVSGGTIGTYITIRYLHK